MRHVDYSDLPALQQFSARDGQPLHYRRYAGNGRDTVVLIHGSSGESSSMHALARALNSSGDTVYVPDLRGHGRDGRPGDIDYIGQLDDDLADLLGVIRAARPQGALLLAGHSSGGGFVLRIAEGPDSHFFDRFVLVSPALAYGAITYRPNVGGWAAPFVGRIIALRILNRLGIRWFNGFPTVEFAVDPHAPVPLDATYSYRMQSNFSAPRDGVAALAAVRQPLFVLVGGDDELFYAERFAPLIHEQRSDIPVTLVPGINHMGMVTAPAALAAVVSAAQKSTLPAARSRRGSQTGAPSAPVGLAVLQRTPWWVFTVLALLIVTGAQALRPRVVPVWRLLIVPAIFIVWGILSVVLRSAAVPVLALDWIALAAFGTVIGWATTRLRGFAFEANGRIVRVPGTLLPLARNLLIFVARYGLAVAAAFAATGTVHAQIVAWDVGVSGFATGYFLGWLARFARARRATPAPEAVSPGIAA
jgi:non-heme chloroperoxidase